MRRRPAGFTIIEMVIVFAITAVLGSTLVPSLGTAMGLAKSAACSVNLRSLGVAAAQYSGDYDQWMPHETCNWDGAIGSYYYSSTSSPTTGPEAFRFGRQLLEYGKRGMFEDPATTYGARAAEHWGYGVIYWGDVPPNAPPQLATRNGPLRLGFLGSSPASTLYITDSEAGPYPMYGTSFQETMPINYIYGNAGTRTLYTLEDYLDVLNGKAGASWREADKHLSDRHPDKTLNLLYFDGHVERMASAKLRAQKRGAPDCVWDPL